MGYFYDNNIRKVPGPVYVYDYIYTQTIIPGELIFDSNGEVLSTEIPDDVKAALKEVNLGRYILFSPDFGDEEEDENIASFAGTIWQKVVENLVTKFTIVADRYTNPVAGVDSAEMETIWNEVGDYVELLNGGGE